MGQDSKQLTDLKNKSKDQELTADGKYNGPMPKITIEFPNAKKVDSSDIATGGENIKNKSATNFIEVMGYGNNYKGDHAAAGSGYHKAQSNTMTKNADANDNSSASTGGGAVYSGPLIENVTGSDRAPPSVLTKEQKDIADKVQNSGANVVADASGAVGMEGEETTPYNDFKKDNTVTNNTTTLTDKEKAELQEIDYDTIYDIRKQIASSNNYSGPSERSEFEKKLHHHYERNVLLDYDSPTYKFELVMLSEDDTIAAQRHIVAGKTSFTKWKPSIPPITIAETASTVMSIQSVQIKAVGGPINNAHRVSSAVEYLITLAQPLGESLTTLIVNSAVRLGMPDGLKATYMLKLHFIGYDPETGESKVIPNTNRQFLVNIVAVDTTVDSTGAIYNLQCVRSGDQGKYDHAYSTDRPLQLNNIKTVKNLCDSVAEAININEIDKLAIEKEILDEYYIHLSEGAKKFIGDDDIVPTDDLRESNASNRPPYSNKDIWDPTLRSFVIPQDTSLDNILEFGISHSKRMQNLAKGFNPDDDDADSNDSSKVEKYVKYIYKLKCDVVIIGWDSLRNEYAREYHYTISLFPTIRPEILPGIYQMQPKAAEAKITALINENFGSEEGQTTSYKCMKKRYDYLFTGLNDKVLKFDIRYNNNFFLALQSYQNLFTGLEDTVKTKITQSSSKLIEFRKQQQKVRDSWKSYLKTKAGSLEQGVDSGLMQAAKKSTLNSFEKEKAELVQQFVDGIKDGTFEADPALAQSLESLNTDDDKIKANQDRLNSDGPPPATETATNNTAGVIRQYAELLNEEQLRDQIESMERPVKVMWGLTQKDDKGHNTEGHNSNKGKNHHDMVLQGALSDLQADMVQLDMEIRGDMYWLESENDPDDFTASYYAGENYLLFTARTSAGEPSLETGIATPGDTHKERLLNGVYAVVEITSNFTGGMFTQNIKGPRETFIYNTDILESFEEK